MKNNILRLRLGIILIIVSWLPIAQIVLVVAHNNGQLTSDHQSEVVRATIWLVQIAIGLIGVWLAGAIAIQAAKQDGWRKTPKKIWRLFWNKPQAT